MVRARLAALTTQSEDRRVAGLEWTYGAGLALSIAAPRMSWALLLLLSAATLAVARSRGHGASLRSVANVCSMPTVALALVFMVFALMSALWSLAPIVTLGKAAQGFGLLAALVVLLATLPTYDMEDRRYLLRGVIAGFIVGAVYLLIERTTDGAIIRGIADAFDGNVGLRRGPAGFREVDGVLVGLYAGALNRHSVALMLLGPAVLGALVAALWGRTGRGIDQAIGLFGLLTLSAAAIVTGHSESAKLGLLAALVIAGVAFLSWRTAVGLLAVGWSVATLAIVALVLAAFHLGAQNLDALQKSNQFNRLYIFKTVADATLDAPIIGIGAKSSAAYADLHFSAEARAKQADPLFRIQVHPHNAYLETWFELGAIGAVLLCAIGLAVLSLLVAAPTALKPLLFAQFASVAAIYGVSYSMWQAWFVATTLIGVAVAALAVGVLRNSRE